MKKKLLLLTLGVSLIFGCAKDETTIQVLRTPVLSFQLNDSSTWKADTYLFTPVSKVVVYPSDTSQSAVLFNRYTLQATGKSTNGKTYQLIFSIDNATSNLLTGTYAPKYTGQAGLAQVQLYDVTNSNDLAAYSLCDNDSDAIIEIQKQKADERIVTGNFHLTLCNTRDSTNKLHLTNGIIKDIKY